MKRTLAAGVVALTLAACAGTSFNWSQVRAIKVGMTEQELEKIMGAPYMVSTKGDTVVWVYSHANMVSGTRTASFILKDKKVVGVPSIPDSFN